MKPVDVKSTLVKKLIIKILNSKLVILLEYQNIKVFSLKVKLQIALKKFLCLKQLKIQCGEHILLVILTEKKLLELFTKKNCKKNQIELELKK